MEFYFVTFILITLFVHSLLGFIFGIVFHHKIAAIIGMIISCIILNSYPIVLFGVMMTVYLDMKYINIGPWVSLSNAINMVIFFILSVVVYFLGFNFGSKYRIHNGQSTAGFRITPASEWLVFIPIMIIVSLIVYALLT